MSIGKKIGGGFLLIVLLNMVVAFVAYNAMNNAKETSNRIATLQVPGLTTYSKGQVAMLQTSRNLEIFLASGSEDAVRNAWTSLNIIKSDVLNELNGYLKLASNEKMAKFVSGLSRDIQTYETLAKEMVRFKKDIDVATQTFNESYATVVAKLRGLIITMSHTQREFMDQGNIVNAKQYAQNMADGTAIFARVVVIRAQLLDAGRRNDQTLFGKCIEELPKIQADYMKIRTQLARQECRTLFDDAVKAYEVFSAEAAKLASTQMQSAQVKAQLKGISSSLLEQTDQMAAAMAHETVGAVRNAESSLGSATTVMVTMIFVCLIISIVLAVVITRMVVKPLAETQVFAQAVAGGDLERQFTFHSNDELGMLADDLRNMVESLKSNMATAHQKSVEAEKATEDAKKAMSEAEEARRQAERAKRDGMLQAAHNLSEVVDAVSIVSKSLNEGIATSDRGAKDQAHIVAETSNSMDEMKAAVNGVAQSASHASSVATDVRSKAQEGVHQVAQVTESMAELSSASAEISKDMAQLGKQANDIGAILSVISDIADQTNLLALNAAIEAARAGEAGRGFAVVADEVRKLAEKTMSATQEVNQAISSIQQSVRINIDNVGRTGEMAQHVTEIVQQSGQVLDEILHLAESSADQVRSIAAASEEQSASCEHIGQSVDHISNIASQVVDTMQEADNAMQELLAQSNKLSGLIEEMKKG